MDTRTTGVHADERSVPHGANVNTNMVEQSNPNEKSGKHATIFAVTSGKGGVGKTSLSVNLACEFSRRGYRTIIVDTDLGLANAHIIAAA